MAVSNIRSSETRIFGIHDLLFPFIIDIPNLIVSPTNRVCLVLGIKSTPLTVVP